MRESQLSNPHMPVVQSHGRGPLLGLFDHLELKQSISVMVAVAEPTKAEELQAKWRRGPKLVIASGI